MVLLLNSSCAIHDQFPFICFRSGCIQQAYNLKPVKKRLQAQLNLNTRKRNARKRANQKESNQTITERNDSITDEGISVRYTKYLVVFFTDTLNTRADSVLVTHSSAKKRVMDAGENAIEHLIMTKGVNNFQRITFRQARFDQVDTNDNQANSFHRTQSIKGLLQQNGIPKKKIINLDN